MWPKIDAAVVWNDRSIRFVKGDQFISYSIMGDEASPGYPKPLSSTYAGWGGSDFKWTDGFDAATVWDNGKAYFFKGGEYLRFDLKDKVVDAGPRPIDDGWHGLGNAPIDAVALWNNGKAYFFRGDHYYRVDASTKAVIAGPLPISDHWDGIFSSGLDAAIVLWDRGKAYFFKNDQYIRYDVAAGKADAGYPVSINHGIWSGLRWDGEPTLTAATSA